MDTIILAQPNTYFNITHFVMKKNDNKINWQLVGAFFIHIPTLLTSGFLTYVSRPGFWREGCVVTELNRYNAKLNA